LVGLYGIGELTAVAIFAELGDPRRFSSSRQAVRYDDLDIIFRQSHQAARQIGGWATPTRRDAAAN
jgi:transposase